MLKKQIEKTATYAIPEVTCLRGSCLRRSPSRSVYENDSQGVYSTTHYTTHTLESSTAHNTTHSLRRFFMLGLSYNDESANAERCVEGNVSSSYFRRLCCRRDYRACSRVTRLGNWCHVVCSSCLLCRTVCIAPVCALSCQWLEV